MKVAVIAHAGKTFGGGLPELRRVLDAEGVSDPLWREVPKSKRAPREVERALKHGAEQIIAWGGDGMVQHASRRSRAHMQALRSFRPARRTCSLPNLGIRKDIRAAVQVALWGERRRLDVGRFNGERFAVMAGAAFDAAMVKGADSLKDRLNRAACVLIGAGNLGAEPFEASINVDGARWYKGPRNCMLRGKIGDLFGGIEVAGCQPRVPRAKQDDL